MVDRDEPDPTQTLTQLRHAVAARSAGQTGRSGPPPSPPSAPPPEQPPTPPPPDDDLFPQAAHQPGTAARPADAPRTSAGQTSSGPPSPGPPSPDPPSSGPLSPGPPSPGPPSPGLPRARKTAAPRGERPPPPASEAQRMDAAEQAAMFGTPAGERPARRISVDLTEGHRDRLRARFDRGEALADYELLELLLFRSIPRRDTKPIAKALIAEFGSFAAVLLAPAHRLTSVSGIGERVVGDLRLVRAAAERLTHDALAERSILGSTDAVVDFYRAKLRGVEREEFHVLYLDKKNKMVASECCGIGTVDHTPVYPREVLTRALELRASAIVLIHNHPSGDPTPSRADIAVTAKIMEGAAPLGLSVHDHIIVGANTYTSLRGEGYL